MDIIGTALGTAQKNGRSVVIMYESEKGISQRRVYVRKITEDILIAYCTRKKAVRSFKIRNILSAVVSDD